MNQILKIVNELQATSGRKEKERILEQNKNNELWIEVLKFVYNPYIVTGISKKKINKKFKDVDRVVLLKDISTIMKYLKTNNTGRDVDILVIQSSIEDQPEELRELITKIITKDLSLGIDSKTINKVYKNIIPVFDVMLAHKYSDHEHKIKGDFILTEKLDGIRCLLIKDENGMKFFSRQGQLIEGLEEIKAETINLPDAVYDGELILRNDNNLNSDDLYRATVKVVRKDGIKKNVEFHVFDYMSVEDFQNGCCSISCSRRKLHVTAALGFRFEYIHQVPILYEGNDKEVIPEFLDKVINEGKEGLMLNVADAPYECKRSDKILKIKKFSDADVRVVDLIEGTGKNIGKLGAVTIQFEHDNNVHECNCGSGFSDEERIKYWSTPELILNKIVTIGYFEVSKNQEGGFGLRFPTWKGIIREDKDEISMY